MRAICIDYGIASTIKIQCHTCSKKEVCVTKQSIINLMKEIESLTYRVGCCEEFKDALLDTETYIIMTNICRYYQDIQHIESK